MNIRPMSNNILFQLIVTKNGLIFTIGQSGGASRLSTGSTPSSFNRIIV